MASGYFSKGGEGELKKLNDNFPLAGPILLGLSEEENSVYLARRVFFNYMPDLNVTLDDEFALTRVSPSAGGESQHLIMIRSVVSG